MNTDKRKTINILIIQAPAETSLLSTWTGNPVKFNDSVSFVCESENIYFELDKEMPEFNVTSLEGGSWDEPQIWPICLACKLT